MKVCLLLQKMYCLIDQLLLYMSIVEISITTHLLSLSIYKILDYNINYYVYLLIAFHRWKTHLAIMVAYDLEKTK